MKKRQMIYVVLGAVLLFGAVVADTITTDTGYQIDGVELTSTEWSFLDGLDQALKTTDSPTFATINTGNGAYEIKSIAQYLGDQNLRTSDSPTFNGLTLSDTLEGINNTINANGLQEGLVGWWGFERNTGGTAYDSSREGNDGTLTNMDNSSCWVAGKDGSALEFDGDDDYVGTSNLLENPTEFTISTWINRNQLNEYDTIFQKGVGTNIRGIIWNNNIYRFYVGDNYTSYEYSNINEWDNIISLYNGTHAKIYLNGFQVGTPKLTGTITDTTTLRISSSIYGFNGSIDDVRVYNRSLSEEEVRALYLGLGHQPTGHLTMKS